MNALTTQQLVEPPPSPSAASAAFLDKRGRVLTPVLVHRGSSSAADECLIDVDRDAVLPLVEHIKQHRLRSKVAIERARGLAVDVDLTGGAAESSNGASAQDPRANGDPRFGKRIISDCDEHDDTWSTSSSSSSSSSWSSVTRYSSSAGGDSLFSCLSSTSATVDGDLIAPDSLVYSIWCALHGVVDRVPWGRWLPSDIGLEQMHAVSFRKGCYLGQEPTARAHYRGIERKSLKLLVDERAYRESWSVGDDVDVAAAANVRSALVVDALDALLAVARRHTSENDDAGERAPATVAAAATPRLSEDAKVYALSELQPAPTTTVVSRTRRRPGRVVSDVGGVGVLALINDAELVSGARFRVGDDDERVFVYASAFGQRKEVKEAIE